MFSRIFGSSPAIIKKEEPLTAARNNTLPSNHQRLTQKEFFLAVSVGDVNQVQKYLEQNKDNMKSVLEETDGLWGYTGLMYAALNGHSHVVQVLVAVNEFDPENARSAIEVAIMSGHDGIAEIIREAITGQIVRLSPLTPHRLFDSESSVKPNPISVKQKQELENKFYKL